MGLIINSSEWISGEAEKWNRDQFLVCVWAASLTNSERSREVGEWACERLLEHINRKGK